MIKVQGEFDSCELERKDWFLIALIKNLMRLHLIIEK
jgi:hypothetical protein